MPISKRVCPLGLGGMRRSGVGDSGFLVALVCGHRHHSFAKLSTITTPGARIAGKIGGSSPMAPTRKDI